MHEVRIYGPQQANMGILACAKCADPDQCPRIPPTQPLDPKDYIERVMQPPIGPRRRTGRSESAHFEHARRPTLAWRGPYNYVYVLNRYT